MRRLKYLPERFSIKWLKQWLLTSLACLVVMTVTLGMGKLLGASIGGAVLVAYFTVMLLNFVVCLIGFVVGKYWFWIAELGLLSGSSMAISVSLIDNGGWEALVVMYVLIFVALITGALGLVVEIVVKVRSNKKPIKMQVSKGLWIGYCALLGIAAIITLFSMDFSHTPHGDEFGMDGELTSLVYSGGTGDYGFIITVNADSITTESYDYDLTAEDRKKINTETSTRPLEVNEFIDLERFILRETNLLNEKDDLSTEDSIMDAEAAFITLEFGGIVFEKGGYYPYDNLSFKDTSDYIKTLAGGNVLLDLSSHEQVSQLDHPEEEALLIILLDVVEQLEQKEKKALYIIPTYGQWSYDEGEMAYTVALEVEGEWENSSGFVQGELVYDVDDNTYSFEKSNTGELKGNLIKNMGLSNGLKRLAGMEQE